MGASAGVLEKINALPEHVQEQLFHYVEFLYELYGPDQDEAIPEGAGVSDEGKLSEEGKRLLEERAAKALANPEKRKHWREVAQQIRHKYNWPNP